MYHRIADEPFDPWGTAVSPDRFAQQMEWLARHRTTIPLSTFVDLHRTGRLPADAAAITFDDAYACTLEVAAPLLRSLDIPATLFIPAGQAGRIPAYWWDELRHIVLGHEGTSLHVSGRQFALGQSSERDSHWPSRSRRRTSRQAAFYALWSWLRTKPAAFIDTALSEMRTQFQGDLGNPPRLLTSAEIGRLPDFGFEIGSHAMTHVSLLGLSKDDKIHEIFDSMAACQALTGISPKTLAYPFGDHDPEAVSISREAGYAGACTVERRAVRPDDDPYLLPRIGAGNWAGSEFGRRLALASLQPAAKRQ